MPIEMPKGLPFSVDTWALPSKRSKRYHFLTHAHKDHLAGISANAAYPIYATSLTIRLLLHAFPQLDRPLFVHIEVGESVVVDDPDGPFTVTAFDANHCPGAVMFLFEGEFGNILHTGDCRLTHDCLHNLPLKYIAKRGKETVSQLDYLFLDCTFGRCHLKMPSKKDSIQQVIGCVWKHPHAPVVYLCGDILGQEEILVEVSKTFGSKIFVDKVENSESFQALSIVASEILSEDPSSRFQVISFSKLYEKAGAKLAEARANLQPEPLFIRPSVQWYATNESMQKPSLEEAEKDEFGVWHVCFSMHSSREELEWALQFLHPKWVISTTPPCRAMELNYVKKHCYKTQLGPDDPLWKLFKGGFAKTTLSTFSVSGDEKKRLPMSVTTVSAMTKSKQMPETSSRDQLQLKLISSPTRPQPITLFGRARLGLQGSHLFKVQQEKLACKEAQMCSLLPDSSNDQISSLPSRIASMADGPSSANDSSDEVLSSSEYKVVALVVEDPEEDGERKGMQLLRSSESSNKSDYKCVEFKEEDFNKYTPNLDVSVFSGDASCPKPWEDLRFVESNLDKSDKLIDARTSTSIGSSLVLNPNLRKLYRSMNVPIPRPLPSLMELMDSCKRAKINSNW